MKGYRLFVGLLVAGLFSTPVMAQEPDLIGTYGLWSAYTYTDNGGKVCFMSALPEKQESSKEGVKRGETQLFVTHWAEEGAKNVVSVAIGYPFGTVAPTVAVDDQTFTLFAEGETAWTRDPSTDEQLALALRRGSKVVVKGVSRRGTETTDTYSLKGSGEAHKAINSACGL